MSVNKVIIQGRIPFENKISNENDDVKAFMMFSVSSKRNFKKADEQYYPEDLLTCKAFGKTAQFINKYFPKGSDILVEGELRMGDDYTKDGEEKKGQMYIHITAAHFCGASSNNGKETKKEEKKTNPLGAAKKNPLLG